jgi:3-hydroxyisobutyrate dehydrogenase
LSRYSNADRGVDGKPILDAFGDKVFYAGTIIGAAAVCKLVPNMIGHGIRQAIAEGLALGVKAGVEPEALWECVHRSAVGRMSGLHEGLPRTVFKGQFEPASFAPVLSRKDIVLATELGREYDVPMSVANLAEQIVIEAMNRGGWGDRDSSITFRLQEEVAAVEVRAPAVDPGKAATFASTHPEGDR